MTNRRVLGAFAAALAASLAIAIPVAAHDSAGQPSQADNESSPLDDAATVVPEPEPSGESIEVPAEFLEAVQRDLDPSGSGSAYVCGNLGADSYRVVLMKQAGSGATPAQDAGPRSTDKAAINPCAGMDLVIGRRSEAR